MGVGRNRGSALVVVLWLLALLGGLVGAFSLQAITSWQVSEGLQNAAQGEQMARSGLELWIARLRADKTEKPSKLLITELMNHWPSDQQRGLVITKVVAKKHRRWVEVFNPTPEPYKLRSAGLWHSGRQGPRRNIGRTVSSGEYLYLCAPDHCGQKIRKHDPILVNQLRFDRPNGVFVTSTRPGSRSPRFTDRVGWNPRSRGHRWGGTAEGAHVRAKSPFVLERDRDESGRPRDTGSNKADVDTRAVESPELGGYETFEEIPPAGDRNEFIELFNPTDQPVNPVKENLRLGVIDNKTSSKRSYPLKTHPLQTNNRIPPKGVGLVVHPGVNLKKMGLTNAVKHGGVRLFTMESTRKSDPSLNVLHDTRLNRVVLRNPKDKVFDRVPGLGSSWQDTAVYQQISRVKRKPRGPNIHYNWDRSRRGGTPGSVPSTRNRDNAIDHFNELWGWGGAWSSNTSMTDRIYLPSMSSEPKENDVGFVKYRRIEDEGGKINLRSSRTLERLITVRSSINSDRLPPKYLLKQWKNRPDTAWLTPGDLLPYTESIDRWKQWKRLFTIYRPENEDAININTAPYEALRSIPIVPDPSEPADFVTDRIARAIIEHRWGESPGEEPTIDPSAYTDGNEQFFDDPRRACELAPMKNHESFQCGVFRQVASVKSSGTFRAVLDGGTLDQDREPVGGHRIEAWVHRGKNGAIDLIYLR